MWRMKPTRHTEWPSGMHIHTGTDACFPPVPLHTGVNTPHERRCGCISYWRPGSVNSTTQRKPSPCVLAYRLDFWYPLRNAYFAISIVRTDTRRLTVSPRSLQESLEPHICTEGAPRPTRICMSEFHTCMHLYLYGRSLSSTTHRKDQWSCLLPSPRRAMAVQKHRGHKESGEEEEGERAALSCWREKC